MRHLTKQLINRYGKLSGNDLSTLWCEGTTSEGHRCAAQSDKCHVRTVDFLSLSTPLSGTLPPYPSSRKPPR
jgi:hypothetical protein